MIAEQQAANDRAQALQDRKLASQQANQGKQRQPAPKYTTVLHPLPVVRSQPSVFHPLPVVHSQPSPHQSKKSENK